MERYPVNTAPRKGDMGRKTLWFGLLGGALAWTAHLFFAYGAAEFGCVGQQDEKSYAGISSVAWMLIAFTVTTATCSAIATVVAYRSYCRLQSQGKVSDARASERYLAKAGAITSGIFTFVILFESIPIFYYLRDC